ncbi:MAG: anthrax toxin lethal factor-related metalloendopeptidase [Bacteriovoracaceae bacterium]
MKFFTLFICLFSSALFAAPVFSPQELSELTIEEKVQVLSAYRDFLREASEETESADFTIMKFHFIEEAFAGGNFDCFYAGWPSVSRASGGKRLCTSPVKGNPDYQKSAGNCGAQQLHCQPAIFGEGLCVDIATKAQKNSAFRQCEEKFEKSGKTLSDVAAMYSSPEKRAGLNELVEDSERICRSGMQTQRTLCQRLHQKLVAVKAESEKSNGQRLQAVATTAVRVTSETRPQPGIDCDPVTPGIQTEAPRTPAVVRAPTPVPQVVPQRAPQGLQRVTCAADRQSQTLPTPEEIQQAMSQYNIRVVVGSPTTQQLQAFIAEFNRFPQSLRDEMKNRGSQINLIVGNGVSEDPSWSAQRSRASASQRGTYDRTHDGRDQSTVPGAGGSLFGMKTPTRIVVNRLDYGGSASLFLHEYGHTLDNMYGEHRITRSVGWQQALAIDRQSTQFLNTICADNYCTNPSYPEEGFAELFAYYHACATTRTQMEKEMPAVSAFFRNLTNARNYLSGR